MNHVLNTLHEHLEPTLKAELVQLASENHQTIEHELALLLEQSRYSLESLERMSQTRLKLILAAPQLQLELGRIFWKAKWVDSAA